MRFAFTLFSAFLAGVMFAPPPAIAEERPIVLTKEQYSCLVWHADRLKIGARGAMVDVTKCPPVVVSGFIPPGPSKRLKLIRPDDIECILRARKPGHGVAYTKPRGRVAVYLDPCGRQ